VPGRHVAPRHRAARPTLSRRLRLRAGSVAGLVPSSAWARTAVGLATAGIAVSVGVGVFTLDDTHQASDVAISHAGQPITRPLSGDAASLLADHRAAGGHDRVSRAAARPPLRAPALKVQRATKQAALPVSKQSVGGAITKAVAPATPREIAAAMLPGYGWDSGQFSCLDALWNRESGWNPYAQNVYSGAYGIPQALPGSKMATFGSDWATNPETQIKWGLSYIRDSYGSPCGAWSHSESYGWY
jgi:Transglycosylase SLT domain